MFVQRVQLEKIRLQELKTQQRLKKRLAYLESESSGAESATENDDEKRGNAGRKSVSMGAMTSLLSGERNQEVSSYSDSENKTTSLPLKSCKCHSLTKTQLVVIIQK